MPHKSGQNVQPADNPPLRSCAGGAIKRVHCWMPGPECDDGMSTTCMLWDKHKGPHEWTRDEDILVTFAPKKEKGR